MDGFNKDTYTSPHKIGINVKMEEIKRE